MKFTKMSLVAALLIGSSAFAIDNVKVSGDAKLYYSASDNKYGEDNTVTTDDTLNNSLFKKDGASAQVAVSLGLTADLTKNVSAGTKVTALSTLGLEGQLVNNVWEGTNGTTDSWMVNELWLAATVGNTTGKIGRMTLDTPLVFSETWSIVENTFEAVVVINQDIPDTTLVGAYVGGANGQTVGATASVNGTGIANVVQGTNNETTFDQFYKGAYAAGIINNSVKPLTVQAWYFDAATDENLGTTPANTLTGVEAFWLQADVQVEGILAGAQYVDQEFQTALKDISTNAYALMLGYEMKDVATVKVAYSSVDKDHSAGFNLGATGQSKLYTEAWWNYGYVTQANTDSYTISLESPVNGMFDLGVYYTDADQDVANATGNDMKEFTVTAGKDFGPLNATLAYIYTDAEDQNVNNTTGKSSDFNTVQAYLTLNFLSKL